MRSDFTSATVLILREISTYDYVFYVGKDTLRMRGWLKPGEVCIVRPHDTAMTLCISSKEICFIDSIDLKHRGTILKASKKLSSV